MDWIDAQNLTQASDALLKGGVLVGGATGLLRSNIKNKQLVDLQKLSLNTKTISESDIHLGAMLTFSETTAFLQNRKENLLVRALKDAASTSLRNRITLGGSIALAAPWSDLIGPLIASNATLHLWNGKAEMCFLTDYLKNQAQYKNMLITGISCSDDFSRSFYYREVETSFDYPAFTLSGLIKTEKDIIEKLVLVITGTKERFVQLTSITNGLLQRNIGEVEISETDYNELQFNFINKRHGSAEYLNEIVRVQISRCLSSLLGR